MTEGNPLFNLLSLAIRKRTANSTPEMNQNQVTHRFRTMEEILSENENLRSQLRQSENQCAILQQNFDVQRANFLQNEQVLTQKHKDEQAKLVHSQQISNRLQSANEEQSNQLKNFEARVNRCQLEFQTEQERIKTLQQNLDEKNHNFDNLLLSSKIKEEEQTKKINNCQSKVIALKSHFRFTKKRSADLKNEIEILRKELEEKEEENRELLLTNITNEENNKKMLLTLRKQVEHLEVQNSVLQKELELQKADFEDLSKELEDQRAEFTNKEKEYQNKIKETEDQNNRMTDEEKGKDDE